MNLIEDYSLGQNHCCPVKII